MKLEHTCHFQYMFLYVFGGADPDFGVKKYFWPLLTFFGLFFGPILAQNEARTYMPLPIHVSICFQGFWLRFRGETLFWAMLTQFWAFFDPILTQNQNYYEPKWHSLSQFSIIKWPQKGKNKAGKGHQSTFVRKSKMAQIGSKKDLRSFLTPDSKSAPSKTYQNMHGTSYICKYSFFCIFWSHFWI